MQIIDNVNSMEKHFKGTYLKVGANITADSVDPLSADFLFGRKLVE